MKTPASWHTIGSLLLCVTTRADTALTMAYSESFRKFQTVSESFRKFQKFSESVRKFQKVSESLRKFEKV